MACTIDATVGGAFSNSYATIAEANTYHDAHVSGATWVAATDDQKCRALVQATRHLDAYVVWDGEAASTTQALAWPRYDLTDPITGAALSSTVVPDRVKWACAEQARHLLAGDRSDESSSATEGLTRIAAGAVELEFDQSSATTQQQVVAPSAFQFIAPWAHQQQQGSGGPVALARV